MRHPSSTDGIQQFEATTFIDLAADEANFENVKSDIKVITENVFERYDDIKVYVYYQEFGINFRAKIIFFMTRMEKITLQVTKQQQKLLTI